MKQFRGVKSQQYKSMNIESSRSVTNLFFSKPSLMMFPHKEECVVGLNDKSILSINSNV